jgi:outer membrane protein
MKHSFFPVVAVLFLLTHQIVSAQQVTLEQVVSMAVERNYDVLLARTDAKAARTDKNYAWGAFLPQINATASTVWNDNNQELRFQDASRNNSGKAESNNTTASVQLNWTLFDGTRMFATRERISAIDEQGELLVKNQMVNTVASAIVSYYDIVRQKQQLKAIREQMSVSEERVKLAQRKLEVGTGIKPELLQARVDYNEQRAQVIQQESTIAQLKEQLNALVGSQLPASYDVADTIIIDLNLELEEARQNVENTSFALRAQRENIRISTLTLRERRAEYLPFLSFNAAYNYNETENTRLINPFGALYSQQQGLNYGFTVNFPILTGLNTRRLTQQAKIFTDRQMLLFGQLKLNIDVSLKNAFTNYENARRVLLVEEETIGLAKENVYIALEGFKRGVTTFIELRTAQQSLADAYNRLIAARYNTKVAETQFLQLSGKLIR